MRRILSLAVATVMLLLCAAPAFAEEEAACPLAREKGADYVVHYEQEEPVDEDWFLDAVMIGDSISVGINNYSVMETLNILALVGQSPQGTYNNRSMKLDGKKISMLNLAIHYEPNKLLIMLGSNGLDIKKLDAVLTDYHTMLDKFLEALPDTEIYLISITPVRKFVAKDSPRMTLENITAFNEGLYALAKEHGVHYIDVNTPLSDEDGQIKKDYCTGDGCHMKYDGAVVLMNAIRLQVIPD